MNRREKFNRRVKMLKAMFPPKYPVTVFLRQTEYCDRKRKLRYSGFCNCSNGRFFLTVNPDGPVWCLLDTLMHEWAHLLTWESWERYDDRNPHNKDWGIAYATVYTAMVEHDPVVAMDLLRKEVGS